MSKPPAPDEPACPRCGAPHGADQEYCLECGYRLGPPSGVLGRLAVAWQKRLGWYPGDWVWPVLLGLVVAAGGAGGAIVLADAGAENHTIVATEGGPPHAPTTSPVTTTVALPTVPTGTPTAPPPATTTPPRPRALRPWPAGQSGYTVILESIPTTSGRGLAVARARAASRAGLPEVGMLESSGYSSLHPGYYVVFSGIYSSQAAAQRGRSTAAAKGYRNSYPKQITR